MKDSASIWVFGLAVVVGGLGYLLCCCFDEDLGWLGYSPLLYIIGTLGVIAGLIILGVAIIVFIVELFSN